MAVCDAPAHSTPPIPNPSSLFLQRCDVGEEASAAAPTGENRDVDGTAAWSSASPTQARSCCGSGNTAEEEEEE